MLREAASAKLLPDVEQREIITTALDRNILVEAAAGTGKTTCMVARMIALLRAGECAGIRNLAAVTFTRKAAAELRSRFQLELERAAREATGEGKANLERALEDMEQCFVGTIHSFCGRLLRERPVEAGVDLDFEEIDEEADGRLREEAWLAFTCELSSHDPQGLLDRLHRLGLRLADLEETFKLFADFPDVEEWPVPDREFTLPGREKALEEVRGYVSHMRELAPRLPREHGNDQLIPAYKRLPRVFSHLGDPGSPEQLAGFLELFDRNLKVVQKAWVAGGDFSGEEAKQESARWDRFREEVARPVLRHWYELRYGVVLQVLERARETNDRLRRERGQLNFQDLLMYAARLLRENPNARRYFQTRFTHLLVDEFQDTDPVQAEILLLLASAQPDQGDWRRCAPRPGSLFVVGDPKQSIYRFRRADIATYNEVKEIMLRGEGKGGGSLVRLSANFRACQPIVSWVNGVFEPGPSAAGEGGSDMPRFPPCDEEISPSYVPLIAAREEGGEGDLSGVYAIQVPRECGKNEQAVEFEADLIARTIRWAIDRGLTVPRTRRELEEGRLPQVDPSDFMVITRDKKFLGIYARKLQEYGVPHQVSGGGSLGEAAALRLLRDCLRAVAYPDDPLALVAVLRGELFGISDAELYAFEKNGGSFSYRGEVPGGLTSRTSVAFEDAFSRLREYSPGCRRCRSRRPPRG
jgi:ATP-dependent helicase/nuclease subunit A